MDERVNSEIRAAGGVLWRDRPGGDGVEVALVHRPQYDDWSIPKGKLLPGETEVHGAIREVFEETGWTIQRLGRGLGEIRYLKISGDSQVPKVVRYWAMEAKEGSFTPGDEVDEVVWSTVPDAMEKSTSATDRVILRRFEKHPVRTATVLIARHASAGSRSKWKGDDSVRPLDRLGHHQAEALMNLLTHFGVTSIYSSEYLRCIQTVEPLAELLCLPVVEEPLLGEDGYPGNEAKAGQFVRTLAEPAGAAVACTQGNVVPDLVERLADEDGFSYQAPLEAKKGSIWALSFADGALRQAEYFPPLR